VEDVTIKDYMIGRLLLNAGTICCFILCEKKHEWICSSVSTSSKNPW